MRKNDKNYEGYHDPTASTAMGRVKREKKKRKSDQNQNRLTYTLEEVPGYQKFTERYHDK